jgi:hypothetical protein
VTRSARYRLLLARLRMLRRHLLPEKFDPLGTYSPRQIDRILAYRLLTHAELEHCLEELATAAVAAAWSGYQLDGKPRTCLTALVAFYEGELGGPPAKLTPQPSKKALVSLEARIKIAVEYHQSTVIPNNHGLSERNVLGLLLPVGVLSSELDPLWLADAALFTIDRGRTAHQGRRVQQVPDPQTELARVQRLARGLEAVDARLGQLQEPGA